MPGPLQLFFDDKLYDEASLRQTIEDFGSILAIRVERSGHGTMVTVPEDELADEIAGELANIALARTMEVRP
jgi:hypothetical protein